jgi:hypothetical protein
MAWVRKSHYLHSDFASGETRQYRRMTTGTLPYLRRKYARYAGSWFSGGKRYLIESVWNIGERWNGQLIAFGVNFGLCNLVLTRLLRFYQLLNFGGVRCPWTSDLTAVEGFGWGRRGSLAFPAVRVSRLLGGRRDVQLGGKNTILTLLWLRIRSCTGTSARYGMKVFFLSSGHGDGGEAKNGRLNKRWRRRYVSLDSGQGFGWVILKDYKCTSSHVSVRNGCRINGSWNLTWVARVKEGPRVRNDGEEAVPEIRVREKKKGCDDGTREVDEHD